MTRSGAPASSLPTCKYFEVMAFLHERTTNKPTESNLPQPLQTTQVQSLNLLANPAHPEIPLDASSSSGNTSGCELSTDVHIPEKSKRSTPKRNMLQILWTTNSLTIRKRWIVKL